VSGVSSTSPDSKFHVILSDAAQCYEEHNVATLDPSAPTAYTCTHTHIHTYTYI